MRKPIPVDRGELEAAIELVEESGPLPNLSLLYNQVSEAMGGTPSPPVVKARIETWQIQVKTQPGRKRKKKEDQPKVSVTPSLPAAAVRMCCVYTPAGKCPYRLSGTDEASVEQWVRQVRAHGRKNDTWYLPEALVYFARQFYHIFSPEHNKVKGIIKSLPSDEGLEDDEA